MYSVLRLMRCVVLVQKLLALGASRKQFWASGSIVSMKLPVATARVALHSRNTHVQKIHSA